MADDPYAALEAARRINTDSFNQLIRLLELVATVSAARQERRSASQATGTGAGNGAPGSDPAAGVAPTPAAATRPDQTAD